ncbi:MAG: putative metal-dependent hydrolase [Bacteroidota bacterium]|nr:putative metal-dependent hydrolase [Bacteroidota bacterium]
MELHNELENLKYPVGKWSKSEHYSHADIQDSIHDIETLPSQLIQLVQDLSEEQIQKRYRPDGWTIRQVIHHLPDSHMNAYIRHKLAVTELTPKITPYKESLWADMADVQLSIQISLQLLDSLHQRWVIFLKSLGDDELVKDFYHPEHKRKISLKESLSMYAWHSRHHLSHVKNAIAQPYGD